MICTNSLAYTLLLAFIPFLVAIASISDFLPFSSHLVNEVQNYFFSNILPQTGNQIYDLFKLSFKHSARLSIVGFLSLIATSYSMMFAVESHINEMWHIRRQRKHYISLIIFTVFFIAGPTLVYSLAYLVELIELMNVPFVIERFLVDLVSILVSILSVIAIYKFIPNRKVSWRHAIIAGSISGVIFSILRWSFALYMGKLEEEYSLLYGSAAILPIFLLWLYISVLNLLYCAQIIYVLEHQARRNHHLTKSKRPRHPVYSKVK